MSKLSTYRKMEKKLNYMKIFKNNECCETRMGSKSYNSLFKIKNMNLRY